LGDKHPVWSQVFELLSRQNAIIGRGKCLIGQTLAPNALPISWGWTNRVNGGNVGNAPAGPISHGPGINNFSFQNTGKTLNCFKWSFFGRCNRLRYLSF